MSVEEMTYNGEAKQDNLLSSDGLLTYRRRKRVRGGESSHAQEDTAISVDEEAFNSASRHGNKKDIGWEHGKPIDGNRYHWKCKYCDFVGQSGGVTRLKKHLAGGWHVTTCPKVPKHISDAMNEHLRELKNSKLSKGKKREKEEDTREEDYIENYIEENEMNTGSPYQESSPDDLEHNEQNMQASLDSSFISSQVNGKDFGWEHGKTINGNRYHWKCKWCNFIGRSGGVTRLKKHLAGGWNVTSCTMVPQHIANTMNNHLMELRTRRLFKSRRMDSEAENDTIDDIPLATIPCTENVEADFGVLQLTNGNEERHEKTSKSGHSDNGLRSRQELIADMAKAFNTSQKSKRSARRRSRTGNQRSRDFYRRLNNVAEQTRNFTAKAIKVPHDTSQYTNICEGQYSTTRTHDHWRSVLEHIIQLPEIKGADGIESSIKDALMHGHPPKNNDKHDHLDAPNNGIHNQTSEALANKKKCQHILSKILCSEKFILLCNLLCESFQGIEVDKIFDFSHINRKMKTGVYGHSLRLFILDIQQMWRKLEKVGEEITHIASSLANMSRDFSIQQVEEDITHEAGPQNFEDIHQDAAAVLLLANNFNGFTPETIIPDLNQTEAAPPIFCLCKQCGNKTTDGNERVLTCNECDTSYHFSCINSSSSEKEKEISTDSRWLCASCSNTNSQSLALSLHTNTKQIHGNCGVCERLDIPEDEENSLDKENKGQQQLALLPLIKNNNNSRDSSVSISGERESNSDEKQLASSSTTTLLRLCKQCGTCEDEDRRFIICGHSQCPYKYYHIRCLKSRQIASFQQQNRQCWYCPSCLCRACFQDRDDNLIVLCDGCDEAYHTYCMKPPRDSVPKGRWYCLQCNMAKAKDGMRKYEEWILQQHVKKDDNVSGKASKDDGSFDVLLRAVDSMLLEESLVAGRKED